MLRRKASKIFHVPFFNVAAVLVVWALREHAVFCVDYGLRRVFSLREEEEPTAFRVAFSVTKAAKQREKGTTQGFKKIWYSIVKARTKERRKTDDFFYFYFFKRHSEYRLHLPPDVPDLRHQGTELGPAKVGVEGVHHGFLVLVQHAPHGIELPSPPFQRPVVFCVRACVRAFVKWCSLYFFGRLGDRCC